MKKRKVKCHATGVGLSNIDAYKAPDGHWYKDETTYTAYIKGKKSAKPSKPKAPKHKQSYWDAVNIIGGYLNLMDGEPFPTYLLKKFKEFAYYDDDVLLETVMQCKNSLDWAMKAKHFNGMINKVNYIMAVLSNHISEVNKQWMRVKKMEAKQRVAETAPADFELEIIGTSSDILPQNSKPQQDLTDLLGGDDLWT